VRSEPELDPGILNRALIEDIAELVVKRLEQLWRRERKRMAKQLAELQEWED
jgi:hypothetical protein